MTSVSFEPVVDPRATRDRPIEGLRALAALAVVMTHAGFLSGQIGRDVLPGPVARLDIGVAVFFVLSGYLLYRPHARHHAGQGPRPGIRRYALRRTARLLPALAPVLVATAFLVPESRTAGIGAWIANVLQLQGIRSDWLLPGLAQMWSLSTEVMFYVALPVLAHALGRLSRGRAGRELMLLGALAVLAWASRVLLHSNGDAIMTWDRTLIGHLDWFAGGMALAVIRCRPALLAQARRIATPAVGSVLAVAASLFWVLSTPLAGPFDLASRSLGEDAFKHVGYGIVSVLLVAPAALLHHPVVDRVLASSVATNLGTISYGIFLWHLPIMFFVRQVAGWPLFAGHFWLTWGLTILFAIPVAHLSWRYLEKPVLRTARRR